MSYSKTTSIDPEEIKKFSSMSSEWWDPNGKLRTLHDINVVRMSYIRNQVLKHFPQQTPIFHNLNIIDVGCGGGLLCEPLCRLGGKIIGIDASEENIKIAQHHASRQNLDIKYMCTTAEDMAKKDKNFDIIFCLEIIEHVQNPADFIASCCKMLKPKGLIFFSTINRTVKSYLLSIVGAEYILRWIPIGTHSWSKFLKPSEIHTELRKHQLRTTDITGLEYHPLQKEKWQLSTNIDVNYIMVATKD